MQNFEALDYLIKNNKQNQGGLRKNYYKFLPENITSAEPEIQDFIINIFTFATECIITWWSNGQVSESFSTSPVVLGTLIGNSNASPTIKAFVTYPDIPKYIAHESIPTGDFIEQCESSLESVPPETPIEIIEEMKYIIDKCKQVCVPITKEEYDQIFKETYDSIQK